MALPIRRSQEGVARRDPMAEINRLNEQLRDYLGRWSSLPSLVGEGFTPLADVEETDEAYLVEVELAGVKGDDIELEVAGRRLSVSGERRSVSVSASFATTRTVGRFHYEVVLPGEVDDEGIEASLDDGVDRARAQGRGRAAEAHHRQVREMRGGMAGYQT